MTAIAKSVLTAAAAVTIAISFSSAATAQADKASRTPKGWNYELDSEGRRVAKDNRTVNPDGSWREEIRQGNCLTVKERSATGEYRETRQCKPAKPS